jgi:hypothetical protein
MTMIKRFPTITKASDRRWAALAAGLLLLAAGCRMGPGEGGRAVIEGEVWEVEFTSNFGQIIHQGPAGDHDVFIVYGDGDYTGDKTATHYDGTFRFSHLLPGSYTVYAYSRDSTGAFPAGDTIVMQTVEILGKRDTVDVGTLTVLDN